MTLAEQVLAGIKGRGLKLRLYEPNELVLVAQQGKSSEATSALIEAVREFKAELIELEQLKPLPKPVKKEQARLEPKPEEPPKECLQPPIDPKLNEEEPKKKVVIVPPPGAMVFVADAKGYNNEHRKGEPYMWTYERATTWWYVKDHPPPPQYLASPKNSESEKTP